MYLVQFSKLVTFQKSFVSHLVGDKEFLSLSIKANWRIAIFFSRKDELQESQDKFASLIRNTHEGHRNLLQKSRVATLWKYISFSKCRIKLFQQCFWITFMPLNLAKSRFLAPRSKLVSPFKVMLFYIFSCKLMLVLFAEYYTDRKSYGMSAKPSDVNPWPCVRFWKTRPILIDSKRSWCLVKIILSLNKWANGLSFERIYGSWSQNVFILLVQVSKKIVWHLFLFKILLEWKIIKTMQIILVSPF